MLDEWELESVEISEEAKRVTMQISKIGVDFESLKSEQGNNIDDERTRLAATQRNNLQKRLDRLRSDEESLRKRLEIARRGSRIGHDLRDVFGLSEESVVELERRLDKPEQISKKVRPASNSSIAPLPGNLSAIELAVQDFARQVEKANPDQWKAQMEAAAEAGERVREGEERILKDYHEMLKTGEFGASRKLSEQRKTSQLQSLFDGLTKDPWWVMKTKKVRVRKDCEALGTQIRNIEKLIGGVMGYRHGEDQVATLVNSKAKMEEDLRQKQEDLARLIEQIEDNSGWGRHLG